MINWCSRFLQETPIPYRDCKLISKTGLAWFPQRCRWSLTIVRFCKGPSSPYRGKQVCFSKTGDHPHLYFLQDSHTPVRDCKSISAKQKDCESNNHPQLSLPFTGDPDPQQRYGVHFSKTDDHPHLDLLQGPHILYKDCQITRTCTFCRGPTSPTKTARSPAFVPFAGAPHPLQRLPAHLS